MKPILSYLIQSQITPNQLTIFTCLVCILYSAMLVYLPYTKVWLVLFPTLMFIRMALNALDGMLAVKMNSKTPLGAVLNELCDVISDIALFSAFLVLLIGVKEWWCLLIVLCVLTEFTSLAVYQAKGVRPHYGPFGKSDRAVFLGLLAILLALFPIVDSSAPTWLLIYISIGVFLSSVTIWNRLKALEIN